MLSNHHLLALTPFVNIVIVYAVLSLKFSKKVYNYLILLSILIYLLYSSFQINKILNDTGGTGNWSNSIYELNNYLQYENKTVGVLDWGYTNNLIILSKSNLKIDRIYTAVWKDTDFKNYIVERLSDSTLYLAHTEKYTTFPGVKNIFF